MSDGVNNENSCEKNAKENRQLPKRTKGWYLDLMAENTKGSNFAWLDPSRLYGNSAAFSDAVEDLARPFLQDSVDVVAGIDAMGFCLGAALALRLGVGFVPIRKHPHLCVDVVVEPYTDYSKRDKLMEIRVDPFPKGTKVVIVDQWIETGGTINAAVRIVEKVGGVVVGVAVVAIENSAGGREIKSRFKCVSCIPDADWQQQIDNRRLRSWNSGTDEGAGAGDVTRATEVVGVSS